MKIISRNKQKDKHPLAGLKAIKQIVLIPLSIFGFIASIANLAIQSAI